MQYIHYCQVGCIDSNFWVQNKLDWKVLYILLIDITTWNLKLSKPLKNSIHCFGIDLTLYLRVENFTTHLTLTYIKKAWSPLLWQKVVTTKSYIFCCCFLLCFYTVMLEFNGESKYILSNYIPCWLQGLYFSLTINVIPALVHCIGGFKAQH